MAEERSGDTSPCFISRSASSIAVSGRFAKSLRNSTNTVRPGPRRSTLIYAHPHIKRHTCSFPFKRAIDAPTYPSAPPPCPVTPINPLQRFRAKQACRLIQFTYSAALIIWCSSSSSPMLPSAGIPVGVLASGTASPWLVVRARRLLAAAGRKPHPRIRFVMGIVEHSECTTARTLRCFWVLENLK
jgi:hypothetical protein